MVANIFTKYGVDVFCLQECGPPPRSFQLVEANIQGHVGFNLYTWGSERAQKSVLYYLWDNGGNRVNLSIVIKAPPTDIQGVTLMVSPQGPVWRPIVGLTINNVTYYCVHAISPGGPDAPGLLEVVAGAGGSWIVAGDYNRVPASLNYSAWEVCWPNENTYPVQNPASMYDYLVANPGTPDNVKGTVLTGIKWSDHFPVGYNV